MEPGFSKADSVTVAIHEKMMYTFVTTKGLEISFTGRPKLQWPDNRNRIGTLMHHLKILRKLSPLDKSGHVLQRSFL